MIEKERNMWFGKRIIKRNRKDRRGITKMRNEEGGIGGEEK